MTTPEPESLPVLAGPTACGKTALAVALAARWPVEIVSADSMQVYRDLEIGVAKPSAAELQAAPHHLIDVAAPDERYDLARFLSDADRAIADIRSRGRIPLVVGGTGLYLKGLAQGIFAVPSRDPQMRAELDQRIALEGAPALHAELAQVDPDAARRISPNDALRIIRALEAYRVTGIPISRLQSDPQYKQTPAHPLRLVVAVRGRESLGVRIDARIDAMFAAGWKEEVERLLASGLTARSHCFKALGYRRIAEAIETGKMEGLREAIALETRQFAKRQMTWFRAMKGAVWLDLDSMDQTEAVKAAGRILFGD